MMIGIEVTAPDTLLGWLMVVSVLGAMLAATGGAVVKLVTYALEEYMEPIKTDLMRLNETVDKIERIERTVLNHQQVLDNGIKDRQERIEQIVNDIQSHLMWDGSERRAAAR